MMYPNQCQFWIYFIAEILFSHVYNVEINVGINVEINADLFYNVWKLKTNFKQTFRVIKDEKGTSQINAHQSFTN